MSMALSTQPMRWVEPQISFQKKGSRRRKSTEYKRTDVPQNLQDRCATILALRNLQEVSGNGVLDRWFSIAWRPEQRMQRSVVK